MTATAKGNNDEMQVEFYEIFAAHFADKNNNLCKAEIRKRKWHCIESARQYLSERYEVTESKIYLNYMIHYEETRQ